MPPNLHAFVWSEFVGERQGILPTTMAGVVESFGKQHSVVALFSFQFFPPAALFAMPTVFQFATASHSFPRLSVCTVGPERLWCLQAVGPFASEL